MPDLSNNPLLALSQRLTQLTDDAAGAVVGVLSHGQPVASGIAWRPDTVVTASDALEADDDVSVIVAGGATLSAKLAGRDATTNIAVLRLGGNLPDNPHPAANATASVGQMVLALGRGGDGVIANFGMVSVAGGRWQSRRGGMIDGLIRLDMRLSSRVEGGVVVDAEGRLLGMPVFGPRRLALVIPTATIDRVAPRLIADGHIRRGYLGVGLHPIRLDETLAAVHPRPDRRAIMVVSLDPEGPARKAGILVGDVIVELDGEAVPGLRSLYAHLVPETVGKAAELKVLRGGKLTTASVTIGASPAP